MGVFLCTGLNMCIRRSTESSHGDGFFEYQQLPIFVAIEEKLALKMNVFSNIGFDICCGGLWESSHLDGSFEYPQPVVFIAR